MHVVIVMGNPKYINTPIAQKYYRELAIFLGQQGVSKVTFDAGAPNTCPTSSADFYIGHSRGADRAICFEDTRPEDFLRFGVPRGIIHPVDLKWQESVFRNRQHNRPLVPPDEHFLFTAEQKDAIISKIASLKK